MFIYPFVYMCMHVYIYVYEYLDKVYHKDVYFKRLISGECYKCLELDIHFFLPVNMDINHILTLQLTGTDAYHTRHKLQYVFFFSFTLRLYFIDAIKTEDQKRKLAVVIIT